jgi:hypothetical protein
MINPHAILLKFVTKHIKIIRVLIVIGFVLSVLLTLGSPIVLFLLIIGVI